MTKKDFNAIVQILVRNDATPRLLDDMAVYLRSTNMDFSVEKYYDYVAYCKRYKEDL